MQNREKWLCEEVDKKRITSVIQNAFKSYGIEFEKKVAEKYGPQLLENTMCIVSKNHTQLTQFCISDLKP
jgi:hypothetical protein